MKIIYIAGYGRSGSTLLDILLGSHEKVTGTGELANVFAHYQDDEEKCSCGEALSRCPFWSQVVEKQFLAASCPSLSELEKMRRKVEDWPHILGLLRGKACGREQKTYAVFTRRLFESVYRTTGRQWILDSSKTASHTAWRAGALHRLCGMDVRVLHLVRDGRSVMASKIRGDNRAMRRGLAFRSSTAAYRGLFGWLSANVFAMVTGLLLPRGCYAILRFEDLLRRPERELVRIGNFLGLELSVIAEKARSGGAFATGHRIAGNRMTARGRVRVDPRASENRALPAHLASLFEVVSWPVNALLRVAERRVAGTGSVPNGEARAERNGASAGRIVHICTTFNHRAGGIHRLYKRLRALSDHGYKVELIVGRDYVPSPEWDLSGITVHHVESMVKHISPLLDLRAFRHLCSLLARIRPQLVHTHLAKAGILGRWAARIQRTPIVVHTVHGPSFSATIPVFRRLLFRWFEKAAGAVTNYFVFVGEDVRRQYIEAGVCRQSRSVVVRTGRPDSEIDDLAELTDEYLRGLRESILGTRNGFMIVSVGRLVPSKNFEDTLKVMGLLRTAGISAKIAVVGEAYIPEEKAYRQSLQSLVRRLGLEAHVRFTGYRRDVLEIIAAADAVLHTSLYEGLSNILAEAAFAATPVVSYEVSGANEVIRNGTTGFIVNQGDVTGAFSCLFSLASDPDSARRMGLAAKALVSDEYRESTMIRNKLAFYDRVLGR